MNRSGLDYASMRHFSCVKLTKIPRVFLKAALTQMVNIAREEGITLIDEAALEIINDKRRKEKNKK